MLPCEEHLCIECRADLPLTHFETLSHNPMADRLNSLTDIGKYEAYAYATALFFYNKENGYDRITKSLKYHRNFRAGQYFARMLGERMKSSPLFSDVDTIIPVPLHILRRIVRGYNQAEVIAVELARILDARVETGALRRISRTSSQTGLNAEQKALNVSGAFGPGRSLEKIKEKTSHALIVDDVFTSGATSAACYKLLRQYFPPSVRISIATLAFTEQQY